MKFKKKGFDAEDESAKKNMLKNILRKMSQKGEKYMTGVPIWVSGVGDWIVLKLWLQNRWLKE